MSARLAVVALAVVGVLVAAWAQRDSEPSMSRGQACEAEYNRLAAGMDFSDPEQLREMAAMARMCAAAYEGQ